MDQTAPHSHRRIASFIRLMFDVEPWRALAAVALLASLGLITGFSLLLLIPLLQLIGLDVGAGALNRIAGGLSHAFDLAGVRPTLISVLTVYVVAIVASGWFTRLQTTLNQTLAHNLVTRCRQRLFEAVGRSTWAFFSRSRPSDYTHALVTECDRIGTAGYMLVNLVGTAIVSAVYVAFALRVSWLLTLLVFVCGVCLLLPLKHYRRRASRLGDQASEVQSRLFGAIADYLSGMKTIRSFGAAERHIDMFSDVTGEIRAVSKGGGRHYANIRYAFDVGAVLMLAGIVYFAVEVRHIQTAEILLLLFLFGRLMPQISTLEQTYLMFVEQLPAFSAVQDMEQRCLQAAEPRAAAEMPIALRYAIELRRVSFRYGAAPAVHDLEFSIPAGETTALVGPSGAGKSTIADLIIGLLIPDQGSVLVDGTALSGALMASWREQVGYVPQDAFLFHDTVRANLLWARPAATADDLWSALRLAAAADFVATLPQGLDTVIGDRGVLVSGGERQRIALARALLRQPKLLILDEATSSLDYENERRIHEAIDNLRGRLTILVITHRLSSIRHADVIHVIELGRLVESGAWDDLMKNPGGGLRALWEAQSVARQPFEADEPALIVG